MFQLHNQCKRRVLQCFIDTAKYAARQRGDKTIKFTYISSDTSQKVMEIDVDEFCENDYGIVLKSDMSGTQENIQKLDQMVQAALQTQMINFSTAMQIFQSCSFDEKIRMIQQSENEAQQRMEMQQQQAQQMQQQQIEAQERANQAKMDHETELRKMDNETKILVATIQAESGYNNDAEANAQMKREELMEKMRQFDENMNLEREKLVEQARLDDEKLRHQKNVDIEKLRLDEKKIDNDKTKKQNHNKK